MFIGYVLNIGTHSFADINSGSNTAQNWRAPCSTKSVTHENDE